MEVKYFVPIICVFLLTSCNKKAENNIDWGQTEHYKDFLWHSYAPVRMEQTLTFDFNEDAQRLLPNSKFEFSVMEVTPNGDTVPAKHILVYKNDKLCKDNTFSITTAENEVKVGIEFEGNAPEGEHKMVLWPKNASELDRIDYTDLSAGFVVVKNDIINPTLKLLIILGLCIFVLLCLWWMLVHLILKPNLRFSKAMIQYPGELGTKKISTGGCYQLVLTNDKKKKCSSLYGFFFGRTQYEYNDFWETPITITCRSKKRLRLHGANQYDNVKPDISECERKMEIEITNSNQQTAKLQTT